MTKEWQQATNEYFQVRTATNLLQDIRHLQGTDSPSANRRTESSLSPAPARKDTRERVWYRASQQRSPVPGPARSNTQPALLSENSTRRAEPALSPLSQFSRLRGRVANGGRGGKYRLYLMRMPLYKSKYTNGTVAKATCFWSISLNHLLSSIQADTEMFLCNALQCSFVSSPTHPPSLRCTCKSYAALLSVPLFLLCGCEVGCSSSSVKSGQLHLIINQR